MNYSYERVSTKKQDEKRQEICLDSYKIDKKYLDKLSGKNTDRPQLNRLRLDVKGNDHIYIESISRLGRNVDDLRKLVEEFKDKNVTLHFIKEGFDSSGSTYKFMLTILGAVAEMERELIVDRVNEGIAKARACGTKSGRPIGRPERELPKNWSKYHKQYIINEITGIEFAKLLGISRSSLYRHLKSVKKGGC